MTRRHRQRGPAPAILLAVLLAAGCAPKRVVDGRAVARVGGEAAPAAAATPAAKPAAAVPSRRPPTVDLPEPEPRGPAGVLLPERRPESVTLGLQAAELAREQLGKPYQWGAAGPDRFDCSGLVQHVYGTLGYDLPRVSREQAAVGHAVRLGELQAGDLLFFSIGGRGVDHVGIYIGDREFVHAPRRYVPVTTGSLDNAWWRRRFRTARRLG